MDAVVQRVCTSWTKKSRGGFEAARRNATPTAFLLPPDLSSALHGVAMRESDSFEPRTQVQDLSAPGTILREVDGLLRVDPPGGGEHVCHATTQSAPACRSSGSWPMAAMADQLPVRRPLCRGLVLSTGDVQHPLRPCDARRVPRCAGTPRRRAAVPALNSASPIQQRLRRPLPLRLFH